MVSEFVLPFNCLNLFILSDKKQYKMIKKTRLILRKLVELFEYRKNNEKYWNGSKLHKQVVDKAFPIIKTFDPGYSLQFLFDNVTSYSVYANNILWIRKINKKSDEK